MRILFDVVHPADVHFFKGTIQGLLADGHQVLVTSRVKDIVVPLLEELDLAHRVASIQGQGMVGLMAELLRRAQLASQWISMAPI